MMSPTTTLNSRLTSEFLLEVDQFANSNADFAGCLIERSASAAGCEQTMTFDRDAAKGCRMALVRRSPLSPE
jgi:predicted nucleic-acid-binding protein